MEFLLFLTAKEKEILELIYKAGFTVEENTPLCLIGKKYVGFTKKWQRSVVICTQNIMYKLSMLLALLLMIRYNRSVFRYIRSDFFRYIRSCVFRYSKFLHN